LDLTAKVQEVGVDPDETHIDPISNFLFALKSPESKRQYPKRLEIFLNFLNLDGRFEEKAIAFYEKAKKRPNWLYSELIKFSEHQKSRVNC
jgi:hypothetical protein